MRIRAGKERGIISIKDIMWFLMLICYFESQYLGRFQGINTLYVMGKVLSIGFILVHCKKFYPNTTIIIVVLMEAALWVSTLRAGTEMVSVTTHFISVTAFIIIIDLMMKEDAERCVRILYTVMVLLIYINVISMLLFPDGLYTLYGFVGKKKYYFLGHQNQMGLYVIVAVALGEIRLEMENENTFKLSKLIILEMISLFYIVRVWSAVSLLSVLGIIALTHFNRLSKKGWRISLLWSFGLNILAFVLFVILQRLQIFSQFFQRFLRRDITLSGRTTAWTLAIRAYRKSPVWGVGEGKGFEVFGFETAHNRYLNTLFTGGLVGFVLFMLLLIVMCMKLRYLKESMARILIIYFTIALIMVQGETYGDTLFYLMFIVASNIQYLHSAKGMNCQLYPGQRISEFRLEGDHP